MERMQRGGVRQVRAYPHGAHEGLDGQGGGNAHHKDRKGQEKERIPKRQGGHEPFAQEGEEGRRSFFFSFVLPSNHNTTTSHTTTIAGGRGGGAERHHEQHGHTSRTEHGQEEIGPGAQVRHAPYEGVRGPYHAQYGG